MRFNIDSRKFLLSQVFRLGDGRMWHLESQWACLWAAGHAWSSLIRPISIWTFRRQEFSRTSCEWNSSHTIFICTGKSKEKKAEAGVWLIAESWGFWVKRLFPSFSTFHISTVWTEELTSIYTFESFNLKASAASLFPFA